MKLRYIGLIIPLLVACNENFNEQESPVAKVFDKYLLLSEVKSIIPAGTPSADSAILAQSYVRNWITKQLLLHKANQNLSDEEKNIRKQVEDYSSSILIHKYKEKLVSQKLDRRVSEDEITRYYDNNKFNFILNTPGRAGIVYRVAEIGNQHRQRAEMVSLERRQRPSGFGRILHYLGKKVR